MKNLVVLGATGSIGDSTLAVVREHPTRFNIHTLSAHKNAEKTIKLTEEFKPQHVVITDDSTYQQVRDQLRHSDTEVHCGAAALDAAVSEPGVDMVVAGIVGNAGMSSVLAAVQAGKTLLLANKESVVVAGELVMPLAAQTQATIVPLDSEHNAIYQCLGASYVAGQKPVDVESITLTASGGPFLHTPKAQFQTITPAQAVAHPKWDMGAKISVDSATLMNKGLEVIEAHWLFQMAEQEIKVLVHPQSIIHSMVNFVDGSVLAQMGNPDMQIPISFGLGMGTRLTNQGGLLDLLQSDDLTFMAADMDKFSCLRLAREAIKLGGTAPAILNASNEVTVAAFLDRQIRFDQIATFNGRMLDHIESEPVESISQLKALDQQVRLATMQYIKTTN